VKISGERFGRWKGCVVVSWGENGCLEARIEEDIWDVFFREKAIINLSQIFKK